MRISLPAVCLSSLVALASVASAAPVHQRLGRRSGGVSCELSRKVELGPGSTGRARG